MPNQPRSADRPPRRARVRPPAAGRAVGPARALRRAVGVALMLAAAQSTVADVAAQAGSHFAPLAPETVVHQTLNFAQHQPRVAIARDGARLAVAWASAVPQTDVFVRFFDGDGAPLGGELLVNEGQLVGTQDEPSLALDEHGACLVAYSERNGFDGFQMGVFARRYDAAGQPSGPPFVVNVTWQQSQWEPFVAARPGGGFVVGWTGSDGGRTYMRLFDTFGGPLTGEIEVAQFNTKQLCPVPAVSADGTTLFAWIDFNGKSGPGLGTSIYARVFDAAGAPLGGEFPVNTTLAGEQREPKTAADAFGRFVVVWEDRAPDGEFIDVHARRFDAGGAALGPEWRVNTTAAGDQVYPAVAADWVGNFVVTWEDRSGADADVRAQRYDAAGQPLGGEFVVHAATPGAQGFPAVALDEAGESFAFVFTTEGANKDAALRRWRHAPIGVLAPLAAGGHGELALDLPSGGGLWRVVLLSFGTQPGLPLPDGRKLALAWDPLLQFVLASPTGGGAFSGFTGPIDASGRALAGVDLPANPALVGLVLHAAVVTLDTGAAGLGAQLRHVTRPVALAIE